MDRPNLIYGQASSIAHFNGDMTRSSFTGKELDEETGYGYFGARYMDHELMTGWLSVDPMTDKYPSISPYAYCAWNPVKLVDPNGKEIWIVGDDGNRYKYSKGRLYTSNGKLYEGDDEFAKKVCKDLSSLKSLGIKKEIGKMEKSSLLITIQKESDNSQCSLDEDGEINKKIGSGSIIEYNPTKTSTPKDGKRDPMYGLAHELGHAYDAMRGMINDTRVTVYKKDRQEAYDIPISEIRAVRFENKVRSYNNQRTTYDGCDLTPYNVKMKDKNGMGL